MEFEDETILERIVALTEMFPEPVRDLTCAVCKNTASLSMGLLSFSKSGLWIAASTFTVLILPLICEQERSSIEEMQQQQQRQMLLGPSAGASAGGPANPAFGMPQAQ